MINVITGCSRAKHMLLRSELQPVIVCYRELSQEVGLCLEGNFLSVVVNSLDAVLTYDPYVELTLGKHAWI